MVEFAPKDVVAIVMILCGTFLIASGVNSIVGICMLSVCGSYFGWDIIAPRIAALRAEKK